MADEISIQINFNLNSGNTRLTKDSGFLQQDCAALNPIYSCVNKIVTDATEHTITDDNIPHKGILYLRNLGSREIGTTHSSPCQIGIWDGATFHSFSQVLPQEAAIFRLDDSQDFRLRSIDGDCSVEILLLNDNRYDDNDVFSSTEDSYV